MSAQASADGGSRAAMAAIAEPAKKNLQAAASAARRFGWISFWSQLSLSVVSTFILIFSVSFSSTVRLRMELGHIFLYSTHFFQILALTMGFDPHITINAIYLYSSPPPLLMLSPAILRAHTCACNSHPHFSLCTKASPHTDFFQPCDSHLCFKLLHER